MLIVMIFALLSTNIFATASEQRISFPITPQQNLFLAQSPAPQDYRQLQGGFKIKSTPTELGGLDLDFDIEYGVTSRLFLGPKANYGAKNTSDGVEHDWSAALGLGFNAVQQQRFLFSLLTDVGYGSDGFFINPGLALFKSVASVGIVMSGVIEIKSINKKLDVSQEYGFALFSKERAITPVIEGLLEVSDKEIVPSVSPGLLFLAVANFEIGLALQLYLPDPSKQSAMLISLLREFET